MPVCAAAVEELIQTRETLVAAQLAEQRRLAELQAPAKQEDEDLTPTFRKLFPSENPLKSAQSVNAPYRLSWSNA